MREISSKKQNDLIYKAETLSQFLFTKLNKSNQRERMTFGDKIKAYTSQNEGKKTYDKDVVNELWAIAHLRNDLVHKVSQDGTPKAKICNDKYTLFLARYAYVSTKLKMPNNVL